MAELKKIIYLDENGDIIKEGHINLQFHELHSVPESNHKRNGVITDVPSSSPSLENPKDSMSKAAIIKNLLVVSFGFLLLFTAFQSLSNLQSSVNSDQGLGTVSLSVIYVALVISCMFVPTFMIQLMGLKYCLIMSILMYSTYFVANFYASWYTLIPSSIILGLGGAPLWTAKCAYLTEIAGRYAKISRKTTENIVGLFFGVFFMIFQSGQVWGNLIAYYILKPGGENLTEINRTALPSCGISFCPSGIDGTNNTNLDRPPDTKVYTLCGIYTGCALLAALFMLVFLDPLKKKNSDDLISKKRPPYRLLVETFRHLKNKYQLLLIPLTIFSGLEQAYIVGDFTQAYVSCAWGIHNVGYVMICFGVADALGSGSFGPVIRLFGRISVFVLGALLNVSVIVTMFLWKPNPDNPALFFVIAALWGLGDAVWQTQVNSLYGVLFTDNQEAAFANYRLWESLGFIIAFAYSKFLCTDIKLYVLSGMLGIGMAGYFIIEIHLRFISVRNKEKDLK